MNLKECRQYLAALDSVVIGRMAFNPVSRNIQTIDGAIVLCAETEALDRWVQEQNQAGPKERDWSVYGGIIESLTLESASYHMDAPAYAQFAGVMAEDFRFWPEILTFEDQGWVTVCSSFDMFDDNVSILRTEIDNALVGFSDEEEVIFGAGPEVAPHGPPVFYRDLHKDPDASLRMDALASSRWQSIMRWNNILQDLQ